MIKLEKISIKRILVAATLLTISPANLWASNTPEMLIIASELLENGETSEAYELLQKSYDPQNTNVNELFIIGTAANQSGDLEAAKVFFEKVLELDPNAPRIKLELAAVNFKLGQSEQAKQLLLDVKALNPPPNVDNNIDRFLAAIEARKNQPQPKNWRITMQLGRQYDSNVNAGPSVDSVLMFGLPFTLSNTAQETSDQAWLLRLSGDHILPFRKDMNWQSNVSLSRTDYAHVQNLDSTTLSASTGPTWQQNNQLVWSLPIIAEHNRVGHTETYYSYSYGLAPQLRYAFDDKLTLNLGTTASKKKYKSTSKHNLSSFSVTPSASYKLGEQDSFRFGLTGGREISGLSYYTNRSIALSGSYYHSFSQDLVLAVSASHTNTRYSGKEAAYDDNRRDKASRFGVDLTYHVQQADTDLILSAARTNTASNLPIYKNDRNQISLSLRKSF